jgi:hypothetical protein
MIINIAKALVLSFYAFYDEIDKPDTKATPKTPLSVATNVAQLGFDFDGVVIQLICTF